MNNQDALCQFELYDEIDKRMNHQDSDDDVLRQFELYDETDKRMNNQDSDNDFIRQFELYDELNMCGAQANDGLPNSTSRDVLVWASSVLSTTSILSNKLPDDLEIVEHFLTMERMGDFPLHMLTEANLNSHNIRSIGPFSCHERCIDSFGCHERCSTDGPRLQSTSPRASPGLRAAR